MKLLTATIAMLGAMTTFTNSAIAEISIDIRFGSNPTVNSYRSYRSYPANIYQPRVTRDNFYRSYNRNSGVIFQETSPQFNRTNRSFHNRNSVNTRYTYPSGFSGTNQFIYNPYNSNLGDRYIVEQRIIRTY
ncbi:hypothetical protein HCU40_17835 [Pseudanabaena biceps]|nr:hypothetical protein [Pseudanabaena biceps]